MKTDEAIKGYLGIVNEQRKLLAKAFAHVTAAEDMGKLAADAAAKIDNAQDNEIIDELGTYFSEVVSDIGCNAAAPEDVLEVLDDRGARKPLTPQQITKLTKRILTGMRRD